MKTKNLSLTIKIWLAVSGVSLLLYSIVILVTPPMIRNFFNDSMMQPPPKPEKGVIVKRFDERYVFSIHSFIMLDDGSTIPADAELALQKSFIDEIKRNAETQKSLRKLYQSKVNEVPIRYVIEKNAAYGRPFYKISFVKKPEEDRFVQGFLFNFMLYFGLALVSGWFVSLFIVRYFTRPLTVMEQHVKRIANRNWHEPLDIKRNDEIGELAKSIDIMRQQLIKQDEAQQSMLQNISHELKTPVMVIRSYAQAMQDGVYPKGDLQGSIQVIDEEGQRLEKLIKQLLYLTRLDYLDTKEPQLQEVCLDQLIKKVVQHLSPNYPELNWKLNLKPVSFQCSEDNLRTVIENLLDNHLRYAVSTIAVELDLNTAEREINLKFWNDGPHVEQHILENLFKPFEKGSQGKFGLGLTIVQRILKIYQGEVSLVNEQNGVSTIVKLPYKN